MVAQTLDVLRRSIRTGAWKTSVPSESTLCAEYQVSRSTLRLALLQLTREGWIRGGQGKRRRILRAKDFRKGKILHTVAFLTPFALHELPSPVLYSLDDLRDHLNEAGFKLQVRVKQGVYSARPQKALEELVRNTQPTAWVLYFSTPQMQRWFSDRGLPCVVCGSLHPGMQLPSVDVDYRATCRHAAQTLMARKHRHIVLLLPQGNLAGDVESASGFREARIESTPPSTQLMIAYHQGTVVHLRRVMERLLKRQNPPSALIVAHPKHVLTVMGHLMTEGIQLPERIALISRDDDDFLSHMIPSVARYSVSTTVFARKVGRIVLGLAQTGSASLHTNRMMPKFVKGDTMG
jgi:DNA-binding LacI/PurR family transcriptional regulator